MRKMKPCLCPACGYLLETSTYPKKGKNYKPKPGDRHEIGRAHV